VRELLAAITAATGEHSYALYARSRWDGLPEGPRMSWRIVGGREPVWNVRAARAANAECDVHLSTDSYLTGWLLRVPSVLMLHDLIAFDPARMPNRRDSVLQRATLPPALRRAAAIVCPSESTRRDLAQRFPRAAERAEVVALAASEGFSAEPAPGDEAAVRALGIREPYVLCVGTLEPRKNHSRLIEAFARLPPEVRGGRTLVIAGADGWDHQETLDLIGRHRDIVLRVGYVPDEALPPLYRRADVACYPSLYEGFGLPVLEAMACGAPVLTSATSSLPEVGGDAVCYADPEDARDIGEVLGELLARPEEREELSRRAVRRAAGFSWERTARETIAVLERAAGG